MCPNIRQSSLQSAQPSPFLPLNKVAQNVEPLVPHRRFSPVSFALLITGAAPT